MDNPPRQKHGHASPGFDALARKTCTLTTDEQKASLQEFENHVEVQSNEQAPISTSTDTNEAISATQHRNHNICCSVNSQNCQYHSALKPSYNIENSGGSKKQLVRNNAMIVSSVHSHNRKRSDPNYRTKHTIRKRSKSENLGESGKQISAYSEEDMNEEKALDLSASSHVTLGKTDLTSFDGQNIESNNSISKNDQNGNAPRQISASAESKREGVLSDDDILAAAGSSRFYGNQNEPKVLCEKMKSSNPPKEQTVVPRRIITCLYCGEGIDKHTKIKSENKEYSCCVCEYKTKGTPHTLQKHIRIHCSKNYCNECSQDYTEGTLHVSQQKCQLCSATFRCRTLLDKHLLELHLKHFLENCWECFEPLKAQYTKKEGRKQYFCCMCAYETNNSANIQLHNKDRRPKLFCKICTEEYTDEQQGFHNTKSCFVCKEEFACTTQLEDHYKDFSCSEYFIEHCWHCNEKINEHFIDPEEKQYYKCCACLYDTVSKYRFKSHLHKHTGLRFFKCDKCDKRFIEKTNLNKHTKTCIPLPSVCEICKARFPKEEYLTKHCLEKHGQTT